MYQTTIPSPLDPTRSARLIDTLQTARIAKLYKDHYGYDAAEDFAGLPQIALYECERTGYRFYYPFELEGKERLYRSIEDFDWTYQEGKWEHQCVLKRIPYGASVLDVGCGRGAFLAKVREFSSAQVTGIELNKSAASVAREQGISVADELIADHAKNHEAAYDVVTTFQVLEHVADPMPFLRACISALKPGGLLVLAVPNNDAFLRFDSDAILNQPPHHVGLWSPNSLSALEQLLPLNVECIQEEPLRELSWYQQVMERRYLPKRWQRSLYYRFGGHRIVQRYIAENSNSISGHTVVAFYSRQGVGR